MSLEELRQLSRDRRTAKTDPCSCGAPVGECWSQSGSMGGTFACERDRFDTAFLQGLDDLSTMLLFGKEY